MTDTVRLFPMKTFQLIKVLLVGGLLTSGCSKPYKIETFQSPTKGLYFTVETYNGGPGPLGSDITKVYANFELFDRSKRIAVLEGDSLTVSKIIWNTPHDDMICLNGGITDIFHNQVTLILGDMPEDSETVYSHLDEHCP